MCRYEAKLSYFVQNVAAKPQVVSGLDFNYRAICYLRLLIIFLFFSLLFCLSKPFHSFLLEEVIQLWKAALLRGLLMAVKIHSKLQHSFQTALAFSPMSQMRRTSCHSRPGSTFFSFLLFVRDGASVS